MNKTKEGLPLHPSQEIKPVCISSGLSAHVCSRVYMTAPAPAKPARERRLKRSISTAVAEALVTFAGSPSDEKLWANFAWRRGLGRFLDAVDQAKAEMAEHKRPIADADKPKILQSILSAYWRKGGAR